MFTGIVQGMGRVDSVIEKDGLNEIWVEIPSVEGLESGASVAINGVCLTAVEWRERCVRFDVIGETLRVTNLGALAPGAWVNVERAARFGDEIGGHLLSGHVHGVATLISRVEEGDNLALTFKGPEALAPYLLPKGYVSLNGCSLTLGPSIQNGQFSVYLIPETRKITVFGELAEGAQINVEVDSQTQAVVDTVTRVLEARHAG